MQQRSRMVVLSGPMYQAELIELRKVDTNPKGKEFIIPEQDYTMLKLQFPELRYNCLRVL